MHMKPQPRRAFLRRRSHSFKPWNRPSQKSIAKRRKVLRFSVLKYHNSQTWNMRPLLVLVHFPISELPQASFSRQVQVLILSYANQFSFTRNVNQFPRESKLICIRSKARSIVTFYFSCSIFFLYAKVPVSFHATFLGNDRGGVFPPFPTLSLQVYLGHWKVFLMYSTRHHQLHDSQHYNCYGSKNFWMLRYPIQ